MSDGEKFTYGISLIVVVTLVGMLLHSMWISNWDQVGKLVVAILINSIISWIGYGLMLRTNALPYFLSVVGSLILLLYLFS